MDIQTVLSSQAQQAMTINLKGRMDIRSSEAVKSALHAAIEKDVGQIIVNFQEVGFIDSAGLSALVSGLRVAREKNKDILLAGLTEQTKRVFELTMLDRIFTIFPTIDDALDAL